MTILYDSKSNAIFDNWIGPDTTYFDLNLDISALPVITFSSKSGAFSPFSMNGDADTIYVDFTSGLDTNPGIPGAPVKTLNKAGTLITPTKFNIWIANGNPLQEDITDANFNLSGFSKLRIFGQIVNGKAMIFGGKLRFINGSGVPIELYNFYNNNDEWIEDITSIGLDVYNYYMLILNTGSHGAGITRDNIPTEYSLSKSVAAPKNVVNLYFNNSMLINGISDNAGVSNFIFKKLKNCIVKNNRHGAHLLDTGLIIQSISAFNVIDNCRRIGNTAAISGFILNNIINDFTGAGAITYSLTNLYVQSGTGNIQGNPRFTNSLLQLPEDYKIQTKPIYQSNSAAYLTGSITGLDNMGAFQGLAAPAQSFRKYIFNIIPKMYKPEKEHIGFNTESVNGKIYPYSDGIKRKITLQYLEDSYVDKYDAGFLERLSKNIYNKNDPFGKIYSDIVFKIFEKPISEGLGNGSILTNDFINKKITHAEDYTQDEFLGYQLWLKYLTASGITYIDIADIKSLKPFVGLTPGAWVGYWIYFNKMIYSIIANTTTTITIENGYNLAWGGNETVYIYKPFKITDMIGNEITFEDPESEYTSIVPTDYIIQNIDGISETNAMRYSTVGFNPYKEFIKSNRTFNFIEV